MAGTIVSDTLTDGSGNSTATTNAIKGSAKAWVNFAGSATPTINASFNVSSITFNATGLFTVNFTTAMADANYSFLANAAPASGTAVVSGLALTASSLQISCYTSSAGTSTNFANTCVSVFR